MIESGEELRDLARLLVPASGSLQETGSQTDPYRLVDPAGGPVTAVTAYFRDLQAAGRSAATVRSYGMDLLRWFRFLWAIEVPWDRATRAEARDFCRWLQVAGKPPGLAERCAAEWLPGGQAVRGVGAGAQRDGAAGFLRLPPGCRQRADCEPVPAGPRRRTGRAHAHHNPMEPFRDERAGLYRPRLPPGSRAASRTRSSTRSSLGCRRTGTGRWWRSMFRPAPALRSCCRRPRAASTPGGS